jgi:Ribosome associated membrane protein RAMP4
MAWLGACGAGADANLKGSSKGLTKDVIQFVLARERPRPMNFWLVGVVVATRQQASINFFFVKPTWRAPCTVAPKLSGLIFSCLFHSKLQNTTDSMAPKQRMRIANEKASKNVTQRGNVPKTTVRMAMKRKTIWHYQLPTPWKNQHPADFLITSF